MLAKFTYALVKSRPLRETGAEQVRCLSVSIADSDAYCYHKANDRPTSSEGLSAQSV